MNWSIQLIKGLSLMVVFSIVIFVGTALYEVGRNPIDLNLYEVAEVTNKPAESKKAVSYLPDNIKSEAETKLLFFGDLMLDRHVKERIDKYGSDYLLARLTTTSGLDLSECRLISANLEGAVIGQGAHYPPEQAYDFAFSPEIVSELSDYGFNFFNLANNHILDQGMNGLEETRSNLDNLHYNYSGCQDGVIDDCSIKIIEIAGKKIGLAGFSMVYSKLDKTRLSDSVKKLAETTDFTIAQTHWGVEYEHQYNASQQEIGHQLIDAGADVVIGHHPHVVQGIEIYKDKPIFYSLGNFIFDQYFSPDTQEGLAVGIILRENIATYELIPFKSRLSQVELMSDGEKREFFNKLINWSDLSREYRDKIIENNNFILFVNS